MSNSLKLRLVSNNIGSSSLKLLAIALSEKLNYKVWRAPKSKTLRNNLLYGDCRDKIFQYRWFEENQIPSVPFTVSQDTAKQWVANGHTILARCLTRASEGRGIVLLQQESPWVVAPVYTLYRKKKQEYRVHCYKNQVVTVLEKRKKKDFNETRDTRIRNTANGYVFCSDGVIEPPGIRELAIKAGGVTGSDFKGVDIGFNELLNELFVIEVNSAPGIQGSNISKYVEAICNE